MSFWDGTQWVADDRAAKPPPRRSRTRHVLEAALEGALLSLLIVALVAGTAFAGSKSTSSVWIDQGSTARSSGLAYSDKFLVGYSTSARQPWAHAYCYPNGSTTYRETYGDGWIWGQYFSVYAGGPQPQAFQLVDPVAENWTAGGADCVLDLVKFSSDGSRATLLARSHFTVAP